MQLSRTTLPTFEGMESVLGCLSISIELMVAKLASIVVEAAANVAGSAQNPVISPALLVSLYALTALLAILATILDARNARRVGAANRGYVVVHVNGAEAVALNATGPRQELVRDRP